MPSFGAVNFSRGHSIAAAATLAPRLPYVRRFAQALTGSQATDDAYARATLEAIMQDPSMLAEDLDPRTALFRVLLKIWNSVPQRRETDGADLPHAPGGKSPARSVPTC
jgi:DNA-directed RNA polymerase specialized sigma24 family protein